MQKSSTKYELTEFHNTLKLGCSVPGSLNPSRFPLCVCLLRCVPWWQRRWQCWCVGLPGQGESEYALFLPPARHLQPGTSSGQVSNRGPGDVFSNFWIGNLRQILGTRIRTKTRLESGESGVLRGRGLKPSRACGELGVCSGQLPFSVLQCSRYPWRD